MSRLRILSHSHVPYELSWESPLQLHGIRCLPACASLLLTDLVTPALRALP